MSRIRSNALSPTSPEAAIGFIAGAAVGYSLGRVGRRKRAKAWDQASSKVQAAAASARSAAESAAPVGGRSDSADVVPPENAAPNDETLADRVRSQAFRAAEVPDAAVNVNVEAGIVYLRGELEDDDAISRLFAAVKEVDGVSKVENLLHVPGDEAPTKRETDDETRRRVKDEGGYAAP